MLKLLSPEVKLALALTKLAPAKLFLKPLLNIELSSLLTEPLLLKTELTCGERAHASDLACKLTNTEKLSQRLLYVELP